MTADRWEVRFAEQDSADLLALLADGWEPFAALLEHQTQEDTRGYTVAAWDAYIVGVRRRLAGRRP